MMLFDASAAAPKRVEHIVDAHAEIVSGQPRSIDELHRRHLIEIVREIREQLIGRAVVLRVEKAHEQRFARQDRRATIGAQEQEIAAIQAINPSSVRATMLRVSGTL